MAKVTIEINTDYTKDVSDAFVMILNLYRKNISSNTMIKVEFIKNDKEEEDEKSQ